MVEYLYDAIKVSAGSNAVISAKVSTDDGIPITEECKLIIHLNHSHLAFDGECVDDIWYFSIPASMTEALKGRYEYCFKHNDEQLCFKQPIYFV